MLKSLLVDLTPLRESRQFRLLFIGQVISLFGRQITIVASSIQIFDLTGESLAVGLLGLSQFPMTVAGSFLGGTLADAYDRRTILVWSQVFMAATTVGLALNAMADSPAVWIIYAMTMINAFGSAVDSPARNAAMPKIVPVPILPAAFALHVVMWEVAAAVGPAVGGVIVAQVSLEAAYWADAITFGIALVTLFMMAPLMPAEGAARPGLRAVGEGLAYLKTAKPLQGIFLIDLSAMVLASPRALFPEWGTEILGGNEATVGLLFAAPAAGAFLAGMFSGPFARLKESGRGTVYAVLGWGIAIFAFGFTRTLMLALLTLGLAGASDALSSVFRNTILQVSTPDRLRGRLSAVQIAVVAGGPRVGDARAGAVASLTSPQVSAWSGGLLSMAGALVVAKLVPAFARWRMPDDVDMDT